MTGVELHSPNNDGFNQWMLKQELYKLKWLLDSILKDSPTFAEENEFIQEHEKQIIWRTIKQ
jgi:hypothetical protein